MIRLAMAGILGGIAVAGYAAAPMEPAARTLYVMLHGVNPVQGGLYQGREVDIDQKVQPDNHVCNESGGAAHIFHTFKFSDFLQKEVTGTFNHTYTRALLHPEGAPPDLAPELGDRSWTHAPVSCDGPRMEYGVGGMRGGLAVEDSNGHSVVWVQKRANNAQFEVKPILTEAVERWFSGELLKAKAKGNNPSLQMDPDLFAWIQSFGGTPPTLAQLRAQHREWIPARFVLLVHSMGGLEARIYIQSDYYQGDVDKVVTLDSPQEGAWAAAVNRDLYAPGMGNWEAKAVSQALVKATVGPVAIAIFENDLITNFGTYWIIDGMISAAGTVFSRIALIETLASGYGYGSGSGVYLHPKNADLLALNRSGMVTGHKAPAFRIFHHEGTICLGDPTGLGTDNYLAGLVLPQATINAVQTFVEKGNDLSYRNVGLNQRIGNSILGAILSGATGLSFMEQGTAVVPYWSSEAKGVAMFNAPGADVRRHLYSIASDAYATNIAVDVGKSILTGWMANHVINQFNRANPSSGFLHFATKLGISFALGAHLSFMLEGTTQTLLSGLPESVKGPLNATAVGDLMKAGKVLQFSHDHATIHSHKTRIGEIAVPTPEGDRRLNPTHLEDFLYEKPYASIKMARVADGSGTVRVGITGASGDESGVWDWDANGKVSLVSSALQAIDYAREDWQDRMALKEETYTQVAGGDDFIRHSHRYFMPNDLVVTERPKGFDFIIDDVRPDMLETFTFSTNYGGWVRTWVRQSNGTYNVYRKLANSKMELLRNEPSPISPKGEWRLEPDNYLYAGEATSNIFNDGQNVIGLQLTNRAGKSSGQRFFLLWQATPPIINFSWYRPFAVISDPRSSLMVDVYSNRYPGIELDLAATQFKIYPRSEAGSETGEGIPETPFNQPGTPGPTEPKVFRHGFTAGQALNEEGPYWFEVNAVTRSQPTGSLAGMLKRRIPFHLDRTAPEFAWTPIPVGINPEASKPSFARFSYSDHPIGQIQGARIQMLSQAGAVIHEFKPLGAAGAGGGAVAISARSLPEGLHTLRIQGRDAAVPSPAGATAVVNLLHLIDRQVEGSATGDFENAWSGLVSATLADGSPAYNFGQAETPIFIDRTAPSVTVTPGFPAVIKEGVAFSLGYRLVDASGVLPDSRVTLRWTFTQLDPAGNREAAVDRKAVPSPDLAQATPLTFGEEVGSLSLLDGRYRFSVEATDDAGNSAAFSETGFEFVVDRQKPLISGYFPGRQTYRRGDRVSIGFTLSEDNDAASNRNGLYSAIEITVLAPDGAQAIQSVPVQGSGPYSITLADPVQLTGAYTLRIRVEDWAGNVADDAIAFGVDRALTRIDSPVEGDVVGGMVALYGLAGSPDYAQATPFEHYELTWRLVGGGTWSAAGLQVPADYRNAQTPFNRSLKPLGARGLLGFWNMNGLALGAYQIRLCSYAGPASDCNVRNVQVTSSSAPPFTLAVEGLPASRRAGDGGMEFDARLVPAAGTPFAQQGLAAFNLRLTMRDAAGTVLKTAVARDVRFSPYQGEPASRTQAGFYLWQDGEAGWHLAATAAPEPAVFTLMGDWLGDAPLECPTTWTCRQGTQGEIRLPLPDGTHLPVRRSLMVQIPQGSSGEATFAFTDRAQMTASRPMTEAELEAYQADPEAPGIATPILPGNLVFLGNAALPASLPPGGGDVSRQPVPPLLLTEKAGSFRFSWDGLRQDGAFPASGAAAVIISAEQSLTSTADGTSAGPRQARETTAGFTITPADIALSVEAAAAELDLNPGSPFRRIAFHYRLTGGDGLITATVLRQGSESPVATLFSEKRHAAKGPLLPYTVTWTGLNDRGHLVEADAGYRLRLEVRSAPGGEVLAQVEAPFVTVRRDWQAADVSLLSLGLSPDESLPTARADVAAIRALPKYRLMADIEGEIAEGRDFGYTVGLSGTQRVAAYPKERFNLFIRRQREEIRFWVVGRMRGTKAAYGGTTSGCPARVREQTNYFGKMVTVKVSDVHVDLPFVFRAVNNSKYDMGWACDAGGCAADLDRTVDLVLLPQDFDVKLSTMDEREFERLFDNPDQLVRFENIHLVNGKIQLPNTGESYDANNYAINRPGATPDPTADCLLGSDGKAGGDNGVLDTNETCAPGSTSSTFDPNKNLVQVGFWFMPGHGSWRYNRYGADACVPPLYKDVGFILRLKVPESYWNPPFGYNNLANRCLRFDPENQYLYDLATGRFKDDGFDNNGTDPGAEVGIGEMAGHLWPSSVQRYRYVPYFFDNSSSTRGGDLAKFDPLSFGHSDHQFATRRDRFQFGFNGKPDMAPAAKLEVTVKRVECVERQPAMDCPEGSPSTILGVWDDANQWEGQHGAHPKIADQTWWRTEQNGNQFQFYTNNLVFEVRLRLKPGEALTGQALLRNVNNIPWPNPQAAIAAFNSANTNQRIYRAISGVRYGVNDKIGEDAFGLPTFLKTMDYVDNQGYLLPDLDLDRLPNTVITQGPQYSTYAGHLSPDGSVTYTAPFAPGVGGQFVTLGTPVVTADPGITVEPVNVGGDPGYRFSGATQRAWSGSADPHLRDRDAEGDGMKDEEAHAASDLDQDGLQGEDVPGRLQATVVFPARETLQKVSLRDQLYLPSAGTLGNSQLSLYQQQLGGTITVNPLHRNLSLRNIQVANMDFSDPASLQVDGSLDLGAQNPATALLEVRRTPTLFRSKELITLRGRGGIPGYRIAYLAGDGSLQHADYSGQANDAHQRNLGYLDVSRLQGNTSLFLYAPTLRYRPDGSLSTLTLFRQLDVAVGSPVSAAGGVVESLYGEAEIAFAPGALPQETYITVRLADVRETGLVERNKLSVIGPVLEVKPSLSFPADNHPRVKIRLARSLLGGADPSSLLIYKPDGDQLAPLDNILYVYFRAGEVVCAENPSAQCPVQDWDEVVVSGETPSFSHFAVLNRASLDQTPFTMTVMPEQGAAPERRVAVTDRTANAMDLYWDDDRIWDEPGDQTPPQLLSLGGLTETAGGFEAAILLPVRGPGFVQAVPRAANGKVVVQAVRWLDPLHFDYTGAQRVVLNGYRQNVVLGCEVNQSGTLKLIATHTNGEAVESTWPIVPSGRGVNLVELSADQTDALDEGWATTRWVFQGFDGAEVQEAGPELVLDRITPGLHGSHSLRLAGPNMILSAALEARDGSGLQAAYLRVEFGGTLLNEISLPPAALMERTVEVSGTALAACRGCRIQVTWLVTDAAGNQAQESWESDPLGLRQGVVVRIDGALIPGHVENFSLPVRLGRGGLPFDFTGLKADGSDVLAVLPNGQSLPLEVEVFRPEQEEAIVWVTMPSLQPGQDAYFTLVLDGSTSGFPLLDRDAFLASAWHFDVERPAADATSTHQDFDLGESVSIPGLMAEGRTSHGFLHPLTTQAPLLYLAGDDLTLEIWVKELGADNQAQTYSFVLGQEDGSARAWTLAETDGRLILTAPGFELSGPAPAWHDGAWHHVALTYSPGQANRLRLFFDGQQVAQGVWPGVEGPIRGDLPLTLASDPGAPAATDLAVDELRASWTERSPAWIQLEYLTQQKLSRVLSRVDALPPDLPTPGSAFTVTVKETALHENNLSKPRLRITNQSLAPLSGFKVKLWLSRQERPGQEIVADAYYFEPQGVTISVNAHPQNMNLVSVELTYPEDFTLQPGESTSLEGAQMGLHFARYYPGEWDRSNDWSWQGMDDEWRTTPWVTLYDRNGALLYGREPSPLSVPLPPVENTTSVFGFEALGEWTVSGSAVSLVSQPRTDGAGAYKLDGAGYLTVQSRDIGTYLLPATAQTISVDVYLPPVPVDPYWLGAVQLFVDCPSAGVHSAYQGQVELTGRTNGAFSTVEFALSPQVRNLLTASHRDLSFKLTVNTPTPGFVLDRLIFSP